MKKILFALLALLATSSLFAQSPNPCPPFLFTDSVYFCDGDSFFFRGNYYSLPGDYYDTVHTADACDSIFHLHLMLYSSRYFPAPSRTRSTSYRSLCDGDSLLIAGIWVKQSGVYFDTLRASYGCDSIDTVFVNFYPVYEFFDSVSVCDSFLYQGQYYYTTGDYNVYYQTTQGCDSIYSLHLDVTSSYVRYDTITICRGENYEFCGFNLSIGGNYTCRSKTVYDCDSVTYLYLIVDDCDSTTSLDNTSLHDITLLPNPASTSDISYLYADFPGDQLDGMLVEVMTPTGVILNTIRPTQFPIAIPAINSPGTYFVRITTHTQTYTRKLLVH